MGAILMPQPSGWGSGIDHQHPVEARQVRPHLDRRLREGGAGSGRRPRPFGLSLSKPFVFPTRHEALRQAQGERERYV